MTHEERKAQKRENYYKRREQYKAYREGRKELKAAYDREYREQNIDFKLEQAKEYHIRMKNNPDYKNRRKKYNEENKDRRNELDRIRAKKNPAKVAAKAAKRRTAKQKATPPWLNKEHLEEIQEFYTLAQELAWLNNGEVLHVDHIIPIKGKEVCGLHVPWNLQLLPAKANLKKGNRII